MGPRARGWTGSAALIVALFAAPQGSRAQVEVVDIEDGGPDVRVAEGIRLYESAELPESRAVLSRALEEGGLSASDTTQARKYLAAALLADGDLAGARAVMVELFQADAKAEVSPEVFVPALVTLAAEARQEVDADRAAKEPPPPVEDPPVERPDPGTQTETGTGTEDPPDEGGSKDPPSIPPPTEARGLSVRAGVFGLSELTGPSFGAGAAVVVGWRGVELSPRLLLGEHLGGEIELAYAFLSGNVQPRLGVRATLVPDAGWGGGQFLGLRVELAGGLELNADAGVAFFDAGSEFRNFGILLNLGVTYRVVGR